MERLGGSGVLRPVRVCLFGILFIAIGGISGIGGNCGYFGVLFAAADLQPIRQDLVWVGKSDNGKSCEKGRAIAVDEMATEMKKHEISVFEKKKLRDGQMRIQMCGADRGDMNGFLIRRTDLERAQGLGFKVMAEDRR